MTATSSPITPPSSLGSELSDLVQQPYRYGFVTDIETDIDDRQTDENKIIEPEIRCFSLKARSIRRKV